MNVFTCQLSFFLNQNNQIRCNGDLKLVEHYNLVAGDNVFTCSNFKTSATYAKCNSGFQNTVITDTNGDVYTFIGSDSVYSLSNRIGADTFQVMTVANENMVVLNNLTIEQISLITGATVAIMLTAFAFRMIRKMMWY